MPLLHQKYYLGADVGASKTRLAIADNGGRVIGFGQAGPGNHEVVGYDGLASALRLALLQARSIWVDLRNIAGAGLGVGGLDFPSELPATLEAVTAALGIKGPVAVVNDALIGLMAGSPEGWGVAVVSGTGCNCIGRDASRQRIGQVTGHGTAMGEGAGASELVDETVKTLARMWTGRRPLTRLAWKFTEHFHADSFNALIEGIASGKMRVGPEAAPLVFQAAEEEDPAALDLITWAGRELGELALAVIRQLGFEKKEFDLVLCGSMFEGGRRLVNPMKQVVLRAAPGARFIRLQTPPVVGAVLLGMEAAGLEITPEIRATLGRSIEKYSEKPDRER